MSSINPTYYVLCIAYNKEKEERMSRNIEILLNDVENMLHYPLNEEWQEKLCAEFVEWIFVHGSSEYSLRRFANQFNYKIAEAEAAFLCASKGRAD